MPAFGRRTPDLKTAHFLTKSNIIKALNKNKETIYLCQHKGHTSSEFESMS